MRVKLTFLYCGLRLSLVYWLMAIWLILLRKGKLTWNSPRFWGIFWIVLMSPLSWQCQNLFWLSFAFIIDWRVVVLFELFWPACWHRRAKTLPDLDSCSFDQNFPSPKAYLSKLFLKRSQNDWCQKRNFEHIRVILINRRTHHRLPYALLLFCHPVWSCQEVAVWTTADSNR